MEIAAVFKFNEHIWFKGVAALGDNRLFVGSGHYV